MPQQKHTKGRFNTQLPHLVPFTGMIFSKKPANDEYTKENSIDFHLEMIKKIDTLIKENEPGTQEEDTGMETSVSPPIKTPVELRSPLNRSLGHVEFQWEQPIEQPPIKSRSIPEEFKTELPLSIHPEFTFVTDLDLPDTVLRIKPRSEDRVEVIDLASFMDDRVTSNKTTPLTIATQHTQDKPPSSSKNESFTEKPRDKKMEVIDARSLTQKTYEDVFNAAMKQSEEIDRKSKIYYLNSKDNKEQKQKKMEFKQSYIPIDFDERSKELKEQQEHEQEKKHEQEEKMQKQLEHEHEKLEKLETKKAKLQEKKHELKQKEKKEYKKEPTHPRKEVTTKPDKEQKRLQRLQIRQARIEERKRQKEDKKALKEKQKQQRLKHQAKDKKQKTTKEKPSGLSFLKKEKHAELLELDDDLKKVLLITDSLLGELPEDVIDRFAQSEDFELYERVLNKYKIK